LAKGDITWLIMISNAQINRGWASLGMKGLTDVGQILTVVCKRDRFDIFCRLSTMHERDKQTDRQTMERCQ